MGKLFEQIRPAVANDRFFVARQADERCEERGITAWQMIAGLEEACGVREIKEQRKKCKRGCIAVDMPSRLMSK